MTRQRPDAFVALQTLLLLGGAALALTGRPARAQVTVNATVTANGSLFDYRYSVFNGSGVDLALIQFQIAAQQNVVTNLQAPLGFDINFDPSNGFVTFFEDNNPNTTQSFAPGSTVAPFTFTSAFGPGQTTFSGFDDNGGGFSGATIAPLVRAVPGPGPNPAIPEPGTLALGLTLAPGLLAASLHRRRASTARQQTAL